MTILGASRGPCALVVGMILLLLSGGTRTDLIQMTFQVIDAQDNTVLEIWPTLAEAEQACKEICQRWGAGEAFVKQV